MHRLLKRARASIFRFVRSFPRHHPKFKAALTALLVGFPAPILGVASLGLEGIDFLQVPIRKYLVENPAAVVILLAWPLLANFLLGIAGDYLKGISEEAEQEQEHLLALLAALDDVEGRKSNRFGTFAKRAEAEPQIARDAFLQITRPVKQIERIVASLHNVLTLITRDSSLQVVLAKMRDDLPVEWRCQMPNDVVLPDSLLGEGGRDTLFAHAARTRKMQHIADIEVHVAKKGKKTEKKYVELGDPELDAGSILCRPLYSPFLGRVLYVLSIKSEHHKVVGKQFAKRFALTFNSFCTRLLLEAHLEVIRRLAGGEDEE